jgi:RNA polymerase subunit RPABC4/transcription elongation factor Spt4
MAEETEPASGRACPWCSALASPEATQCPACGAALAQRESIGDLVIPGVTNVDPALQSYAAQPLRIPGSSPSHGIAGGAVVAAAAAGGPLGLVALGGLAAVAASEYLGAGRGMSGAAVDVEDVGRPSEAVLQALTRLDHEAALTPAPRAGTGSQHVEGDSTEEDSMGAENNAARDPSDPAA